MKRKKIIGFMLFCLFLIASVCPVSSQEVLEDVEWEKGYLTAVGEDFIAIDGFRYHVSPEVEITGVHGDSLGSELKKLRETHEIMYRISGEEIIEIRILRLTS